ncbi:prolyl oligopeptidase family serine peptidase [Chitinophaga sp.]|uniref:S9 family peptidase n=1 Tax=Chitinophaga sp. TaxID=1869181 RepID=UPI0031D065D5
MKRNLLLAALLGSQVVVAQKKEIDTSAYKEWRRTGTPSLSYDGQWMLYHYSGDEQRLQYLVNTTTGKATIFNGISSPEFIGRGKWMKFTRNDSMVLRRLKDGHEEYWTRSSYFIGNDQGTTLSYSAPGRQVVVDINTGDSTVLKDVNRCNFYDGGVVYIKGNQLLAGPLKGKHNVLFEGAIDDFSFNRDQGAGTILSDKKLYYFSIKTGKTTFLLDYRDIKAPAGYKVAEQALSISPATKQFVLDVMRTEQPAMRKQAENTGFQLELWTWNEPVTQRLQRRGVYDKNMMNQAKFIYNIDTRTVVEVAPEMSGQLVTPSSETFDYVIALDPAPYKVDVDYRYNSNVDIYLVNVHTGERKLIAKDSYETPTWSPNGRFAVYYDTQKKIWERIDLGTGQFVNISGQIGFPVNEEDWDQPGRNPAYGLAGYLDGGNTAVFYDRYDMWAVDLSGERKPYSLTGQYGRQHKVVLRLNGVEYMERMDLSKPLLLRSFNEETKTHGLYKLQSLGKVEKVVDNPDYSVKVSSISGDGRSCLFTKESYQINPDVWYGDPDFKKTKQLTDYNPQQQDYKWGTAKVVRWKTFDGKDDEGLLYLPEGYDSTRVYPMIVDFYETHTQDLHDYIVPEYSTSSINITTYVSRGYLVFRPDVHYVIGKPGESVYNCVVSGVNYLIEKGIADKDAIGLQGHSFGGYEASYLVTRTDVFRCANIGAGVVNMTYNYTAMRQNGAPCLFKFESEQYRMGKSLWEDKEGYISNSAIFNADKIHTPLMIFHNDKDGAVPFSQGLDLFLSMRRLQRPAWLLNYKGGNHTLEELPAQKDFTIRMQGFFDHYLKKTPMPRWMSEGISVDERNVDQKY